jgi:hypothetical protein
VGDEEVGHAREGVGGEAASPGFHDTPVMSWNTASPRGRRAAASPKLAGTCMVTQAHALPKRAVQPAKQRAGAGLGAEPVTGGLGEGAAGRGGTRSKPATPPPWGFNQRDHPPAAAQPGRHPPPPVRGYRQYNSKWSWETWAVGARSTPHHPAPCKGTSQTKTGQPPRVEMPAQQQQGPGPHRAPTGGKQTPPAQPALQHTARRRYRAGVTTTLG